MMRPLLLLLLPICILSCQGIGDTAAPQQHNRTDSASVSQSPTHYLNIQMNEFVEIDSSGILIFPLDMGESERDGSSKSYKDVSNSGYWNIVFYNTATKAYHLLSDKKMLIQSYDLDPASASTGRVASHAYIFYQIRTDDINKDKKLTHTDPTYLYISDRSGNNFRQISPQGYHIRHWQLLKSSDKVIMTLVKDSDRNNKYDSTDEVTTFEFELQDSAQAREIFPAAFKQQLRTLYDKDWKRIDK